ncbi:hypothetical protein TNCV_3790211 [Trichonephila clavipes]|nr:hypothetical protein TNCV_3790211 [Trichonephila clavipes]
MLKLGDSSNSYKIRVCPLDPRPDAVALHSGSTPGKRLVWFLPDDRHTASVSGLCGGWRHARMKSSLRLWIKVGCTRLKNRPTVPLLNTTTSNSHTSAVPNAANNLKQSRKNKKKRTTEEKPDIEIQMTPYKPKKSNIHYTSEDEEMIIYDVDESLNYWNIKSGFNKCTTPTRNWKKYRISGFKKAILNAMQKPQKPPATKDQENRHVRSTPQVELGNDLLATSIHTNSVTKSGAILTVCAMTIIASFFETTT